GGRICACCSTRRATRSACSRCDLVRPALQPFEQQQRDRPADCDGGAHTSTTRNHHIARPSPTNRCDQARTNNGAASTRVVQASTGSRTTNRYPKSRSLLTIVDRTLRWRPIDWRRFGDRSLTTVGPSTNRLLIQPQHGHEGLLRDVDVADALHPPLTLLLLLEQLPLAG